MIFIIIPIKSEMTIIINIYLGLWFKCSCMGLSEFTEDSFLDLLNYKVTFDFKNEIFKGLSTSISDMFTFLHSSFKTVNS